MRATAKAYELKDSITTINKSEEKEEEYKQEEGWTTPVNCMTIMHFCKKTIKTIEKKRAATGTFGLATIMKSKTQNMKSKW